MVRQSRGEDRAPTQVSFEREVATSTQVGTATCIDVMRVAAGRSTTTGRGVPPIVRRHLAIEPLRRAIERPIELEMPEQPRLEQVTPSVN